MQKVIGTKKTLQVLHIFPKNLLNDKNLANEIVHSKCVPSNASLPHYFSYLSKLLSLGQKYFLHSLKAIERDFFA